MATRIQNIIRAFCFALFFLAGSTAMSLSILTDELIQYHNKKQLLSAEIQHREKLKSLNTDYQVLLEQLRTDPNLIKRIAPAILGTSRVDPNTIYPKVTTDQLAATARALTAPIDPNPTADTIPAWLTRISQPYYKTILFVSGAFLILISLVFFAPTPKD